MKTLVAVCDYGVGNLRSVERALQKSGAKVVITNDPGLLTQANGIILPGVGAFGVAAHTLHQRGLAEAITSSVNAGRPIMGICLGFQLLFESSEEGDGRGLAFFGGSVRSLQPNKGKLPHLGWNQITISGNAPLLAGVADGSYMYFVHSFAPIAEKSDVVATAWHGGQQITAACQRGNVMGTQFHPEKSSTAGLCIYENFVALCSRENGLQ